MATFLKSEGYRARAIHPGTNWFWNRGAVYADFGFNDFKSEETLPPMEKRGPLASDAAMTDEIISEADASDDPVFFFAVSLQNHGPYEPNRYYNPTHTVQAPISQWARNSLLSYAEGSADADRGLERLVEWAKKRSRPTVIAFFGDHLPPLGPVYVETGFLKDNVAPRKEASPEAALEHHETPLVIWSNRTGPAEDLGAVSPAFLPYHILKTAGITHPYYTGLPGRDERALPRRRPQPVADAGWRGHARLGAAEGDRPGDPRFPPVAVRYDVRQTPCGARLLPRNGRQGCRPYELSRRPVACRPVPGGVELSVRQLQPSRTCWRSAGKRPAV